MAEAPVVVTGSRLQTFIVDALVAMKRLRARAEVTAGLMVRRDLGSVGFRGIGMLPRY